MGQTYSVKIVPEYQTIVNRFNKVMLTTCHEYLRLTENGGELTDDYLDKGYLTIGDLIHEVKMQYDTYFEDGHVNCELQWGDVYERKCYVSETGKWKRLLDRLRQYKQSEKVAILLE